ncbi:hypothetical protein BDY21DRAFT_338705 [Lineolata rhizophorae]|uniref:Uncharacterized protein n=1 Tax=Lineolata rhizophorae TaxID=578093 RepID=A0A6A6P6K0_9PEZI|nr:hypothetical protein BDY21DRAFT_338705 [Lineolata rhizophorae]
MVVLQAPPGGQRSKERDLGSRDPDGSPHAKTTAPHLLEALGPFGGGGRSCAGALRATTARRAGRRRRAGGGLLVGCWLRLSELSEQCMCCRPGAGRTTRTEAGAAKGTAPRREGLKSSPDGDDWEKRRQVRGGNEKGKKDWDERESGRAGAGAGLALCTRAEQFHQSTLVRNCKCLLARRSICYIYLRPL